MMSGDGVHPDSVFSNLKVRQAICYAVDRDAIAKSFGYGYWPVTPRHQLALPGEWCDNPDVKGYPYNPEKAKQLLAEAGYPNGFEVTCTTAFKIVTGSEILAQILQADLAKIGVKMKIEDNESAVIRPNWFKG